MSPRRPSRLALATALLVLGTFAPSSFFPFLHAAPLEHDLQQGLAYLRSSDLDADLLAVEKTLTVRPSLIVDLRQATSGNETATAFARLLAHPPATARFSRIILVSRNTAPSLLKQLAASFPGTVTLAARTEGLNPDVSVITTPEEDTLAYEALTSGAALDKLLSGTTPQKVRYDEVSLTRDHANGSNSHQRSTAHTDTEVDPASSEQTGATHATPADKAKPTASKPPAPPVDRVLLRAVQLHRALLALKKL
jgi:hypothetical protein